MFISRLNQIRDKLTYSEQLIANMLTENYRNFEVMTSAQVAKSVGCGQATVIRFSQKLGYPSFKSMMLDIANESIFYEESKMQKQESLRDTMVKLKNIYEDSVNDALRNNSDDDIVKAVHYLESANTVFCYGIRSSFVVASLMYYRLLETGRSVLRSETLLEGVSIAHNLDENDAMLVVSISGETAEVITVVNEAHERGAKIVSITGSKNNTIQKLSDVALQSAEYNVYTNQFNLVNRMPAIFLIDCLFLKMWKNNEDEMIKGNEVIRSAVNNRAPEGVHGTDDIIRL